MRWVAPGLEAVKVLVVSVIYLRTYLRTFSVQVQEEGGALRRGQT